MMKRRIAVAPFALVVLAGCGGEQDTVAATSTVKTAIKATNVAAVDASRLAVANARVAQL